MEYDQKLDVITYLGMVEEIADGFFVNGEYQPHIGKMNAMRLFYNKCVVHDGNDIDDFDGLIAVLNETSLTSYFKEAVHTYEDHFCFSEAYADAMDIVSFKKGSIGSLLDYVTSWLTKIADDMKDALSEDNLDKISQIAERINNGESISNAVMDSAQVKTEILEFPKKD